MAAGLGFKEFTTGDVLTAADANGYLASQVVMVFADAAARTSAITSPQEGMISFLKDTNSTEYYSGSAWVAIGGAPATSGLNLISRVPFSGVAGQNFDNVFDTTYATYRVVVETIASSTAASTLEFQTRVGGVTRTASYYGAVGRAIFNSSSYNGTDTVNNDSSLQIGTANLGPTLTTVSFDIYQVGQNARFNLSGTGVTGETGIVTFFGGYRGATEVVDGFRLLASAGNITGTVAIYGYGV